MSRKSILVKAPLMIVSQSNKDIYINGQENKQKGSDKGRKVIVEDL